MSISINILSCVEDPQTVLISAFQRRDLEAFKYAVDHLRADVTAVDPKVDMSIFENVLMTPDSDAYIRLCMEAKPDLYKKNALGRYPLYYAIDSLCPDNLRMFLRFYDKTKVNVKFGSDNCLHSLISFLPNEKEDKIAECIKIMLSFGCNPNMANEKSRTPFHALLRIQPKLKNPNQLVKFFIENSKIDLYTYSKNDEILKLFKKQLYCIVLFKKQNPLLDVPGKIEKNVDFDYMMHLIRARQEREFENNYQLFKDNSQNNAEGNESNNFPDACATFLYEAVVNNLEDVVELLLNEGVDINKKSSDSAGKKPPAFYAASAGFFRILEIMIASKQELVTTYKGRNLLHEICSNFGMEEGQDKRVNHQKCFHLVVKAFDVNQADKDGCIPLHYAVRYQNNEAVKALLERSSYIGAKNRLGESPIDDINRDVLEEFLNESISAKKSHTSKDEQEVYIDFKILKAPKDSKADKFRPEIAPLQSIAENPELRQLILHPVFSSFLFLKWSKLSWLHYGNLFVFSFFVSSLIVFMVLCQSIPAAEKYNNGAYRIFYLLSLIGVIMLMIREIFQCVLSVQQYLKSLINWFEIVLIICSLAVLLLPIRDSDDDKAHRILRAFTILLAAYEFLQLVGTLPIFSISTHRVILEKVTITFLKSIALYSILLLAFALSFYTLFGGKEQKDKFNSFDYPGIAIIKTLVMLTGEFDAAELNLHHNGTFYCIIFLLFVVLVTIVLFNLLNALAVDDTRVIKAEGQLADFCQRISVLNKYEKIVLSRPGCCHYFESLISVFPTIPEAKIAVHPNNPYKIKTHFPVQSSGEVCVDIEASDEIKQPLLKISSFNYPPMYPGIIKKIRNVIEKRTLKQLRDAKDENLLNHIRSMDSQLSMLTDLMMKAKA